MMPKRRTLLHSDEKRKTLQNVALARGRLKGALKHKQVSTDDNSDSDESEEEKHVKKPRIDTLNTHHQPYIMKLFDRSIDLARFREDSPLYPLCRAWWKNQPRLSGGSETTKKLSRTPIKREYNPDIVDLFMDGEISEITEMPRPELTDMVPFYLEKQEPVEDLELNSSLLGHDELMDEHLVRWKKIRETWISHRKQYEEKRYGTSFRLLEALEKKT